MIDWIERSNPRFGCTRGTELLLIEYRSDIENKYKEYDRGPYTPFSLRSIDINWDDVYRYTVVEEHYFFQRGKR